MKKILLPFVIIFSSLLFIPTVFAKQYTIDSINLKIDLPDSYIVATRATTDEKILKDLGYDSRNAAIKEMNELNIHLLSLNNNLGHMLDIRVLKNTPINENFDLKMISKEKRKIFAENLINGVEIDNPKFGEYESKNILYITIEGFERFKEFDGQKLFISSYFTIQNGAVIGFKMVSFENKNNLQSNNLLRTIVDNAVYTKPAPPDNSTTTTYSTPIKKLTKEQDLELQIKYGSPKHSILMTLTEGLPQKEASEILNKASLYGLDYVIKEKYPQIYKNIDNKTINKATNAGAVAYSSASQGHPQQTITEKAITKGLTKGLAVAFLLAAFYLIRYLWQKSKNLPHKITEAKDTLSKNTKNILNTNTPDKHIETLKKLDELRASGIITEEEFTKKKTDILNKL